jgi:hypothetical protein
VREIVERETLETSHAVGKSVSDGGEWGRCGPQGRSFLYLSRQGCTFSSAGQHQFALPDKTLGKVTA